MNKNSNDDALQTVIFHHFCMAFWTIVNTLECWHDDLTDRNELFEIGCWPSTIYEPSFYIYFDRFHTKYCPIERFSCAFLSCLLFWLIEQRTIHKHTHAKLRQLLTKYGTWILNALCQRSNPYIVRLINVCGCGYSHTHTHSCMPEHLQDNCTMAKKLQQSHARRHMLQTIACNIQYSM